MNFTFMFHTHLGENAIAVPFTLQQRENKEQQEYSLSNFV